MAKKSAGQATFRPLKDLSRFAPAATGQATRGGSRKPPGERSAAAPAAPPRQTAARSDEELFLAAMADAERLPTAAQTVPPARRPPPVPRPSDDELALAELAALCAGSGAFEAHGSEEEWYGAAPGVSHALLDALKRGQFPVQASLDLHGLVRDQAHEAVARFVAQARCREGATCVLVVTGRGRSSPLGLSVLRQALPRWLSRAPCRAHVLAYATARSVDGGPGAFYVLLRRQGVAPFGGGVP